MLGESCINHLSNYRQTIANTANLFFFHKKNWKKNTHTPNPAEIIHVSDTISSDPIWYDTYTTYHCRIIRHLFVENSFEIAYIHCILRFATHTHFFHSFWCIGFVWKQEIHMEFGVCCVMKTAGEKGRRGQARKLKRNTHTETQYAKTHSRQRNICSVAHTHFLIGVHWRIDFSSKHTTKDVNGKKKTNDMLKSVSIETFF